MHPPALEGRSNLIDEFLESIEDGPGAPGRLTLYSGPRGIGKTVMLNAVGDSVAERMQWLVIHETATPGFTSRLAKAASNLLDHTSPVDGTITICFKDEPSCWLPCTLSR